MPNFSEWLAQQRLNDPSIDSLRAFARAKSDKWPSSSDNIEDYASTIRESTDVPNKESLLVALGRVYERWLELGGGRGKSAGYLGLIGLFVGGIIIASSLSYGIFINTSFFDLMSNADHARGLITFVFAFAAIGIVILVAIAIFWVDISEVKERFDFAKDLITILVGTLGTILGFYFGTANK
jgi:hypothetical protein